MPPQEKTHLQASVAAIEAEYQRFLEATNLPDTSILRINHYGVKIVEWSMSYSVERSVRDAVLDYLSKALDLEVLWLSNHPPK